MAGDAATLQGESFDAIIVGTGLPESILSAALSLTGARVLHLDPNPFYGSHHATMPLADVHALASKAGSPRAPPDADAPRSPTPAPTAAVLGENAQQTPFSLGSPEAQAFGLGARLPRGGSAAVDLPRRVMIDLAPRTVLGAGALVDLLIQTGVGHYLSFRPLDATFLYFPDPTGVPGAGRLERVPASRSDVFQSTFLSMIEKRLLVRFLKSAEPKGGAQREAGPSPSDGGGADDDDTLLFEDLMDRAKLTGNLQSFLRHCIAFTEDTAPAGPERVTARAGRGAVRLYLKSLMRYGTQTPFLYPNYGSGEMCEAFCRLSAVHGGTFVLRKRVDALVTGRRGPAGGADDGASAAVCGVVTSDGEKLRAPHLFVSAGLLPRAAAEEAHDGSRRGTVWHFVCLLEEPAFPRDGPRALAVFPRGCCGNGNATVRVLQMDGSAEVCPDGMFILSAETVGGRGCEQDIASVVACLVRLEPEGGERGGGSPPRALPRVLWSVWYPREVFRSPPTRRPPLFPDGLTVVHDVPVKVDASEAIAEALRCFRVARPTADFFPAPALAGGEAGGGSAGGT
jgi:Rab proteins geranylgeranyltransferase component A